VKICVVDFTSGCRDGERWQETEQTTETIARQPQLCLRVKLAHCRRLLYFAHFGLLALKRQGPVIQRRSQVRFFPARAGGVYHAAT
jgi:hypothetical protein